MDRQRELFKKVHSVFGELSEGFGVRVGDLDFVSENSVAGEFIISTFFTVPEFSYMKFLLNAMRGVGFLVDEHQEDFFARVPIENSNGIFHASLFVPHDIKVNESSELPRGSGIEVKQLVRVYPSSTGAEGASRAEIAQKAADILARLSIIATTIRSRSPSLSSLEPLTPREVEVVSLVAEGLSSQDVARRLGISHRTVHRHRENINKKLNFSTTIELTKFAIRKGIASL